MMRLMSSLYSTERRKEASFSWADDLVSGGAVASSIDFTSSNGNALTVPSDCVTRYPSGPRFTSPSSVVPSFSSTTSADARGRQSENRHNECTYHSKTPFPC